PSPIPRELLRDVFRLGRELKRRHRAALTADPKLKDRVVRLLRSILPPKPRRRGRPGIHSVTVAIKLQRSLKRKYPHERPAQIWERIYPLAIPNYESMSPLEQKNEREQLRERVRWRLRRRGRSQPRAGKIRL